MQHLLTTKPSIAPCPGCNRLVAEGHADGLRFRVELLPVHARAELRLKQEGVKTWMLLRDDTLTFRTVHRIKFGVARPVFASHSCARSLGAEDAERRFVAAAAELAGKYRVLEPVEPAVVEAEALLSRELDAVAVEEPAPF